MYQHRMEAVGRYLIWVHEALDKQEAKHWQQRVYDWAQIALNVWMQENCV